MQLLAHMMPCVCALGKTCNYFKEDLEAALHAKHDGMKVLAAANVPRSTIADHVKNVLKSLGWVS